MILWLGHSNLHHGSMGCLNLPSGMLSTEGHVVQRPTIQSWVATFANARPHCRVVDEFWSAWNRKRPRAWSFQGWYMKVKATWLLLKVSLWVYRLVGDCTFEWEKLANPFWFIIEWFISSYKFWWLFASNVWWRICLFLWAVKENLALKKWVC